MEALFPSKPPPCLLHVYGGLPALCLCTTHIPGAVGAQKGALDPPELELQTVVSRHVGAGN